MSTTDARQTGFEPPAEFQYDLICLGSGPAGEKAATQAAYYGHRAVVVERATRPGGAMVNTGTVPSKVLRETSLLCSAFRRRPLPGFAQEIDLDHGLSVTRFMAQRHLIVQQEHDRIEASFDRQNIDVLQGHGRLVSPWEVAVERGDGSTITVTAPNILVATGSAPAHPAFVPFGDPNIVDADQVLALQRLPRSMIIVGGGVIGCEYASIFAEIDVNVTLVHPRETILPFIDPVCRAHLVRAMQEQGVDFRLGASVEAVDGLDDDRVRVTLDDHSTLHAEVLLWAAGRRPNTQRIGLEAIGVEMDDHGTIRVDERYRTNVPSIWAAGDVIGFPALASTSMEQGRIAACHMFGLDFKTKLAETIPIGIYTIPGVSMVGISEADAKEKGRDVIIGTARYRDNVRGRMLGDDNGILRCIFDRRSRQLVGAAVVGEQATELIHLAQLAIAGSLGIDDLINACFNYPSLSELFKYAAYSALQNDFRTRTIAAAA